MSRNQNWMDPSRAAEPLAYGRADLTGQIRFVLLLMAALAAGSTAVAAHWDLPHSWLIPQWLIDWLMPVAP